VTSAGIFEKHKEAIASREKQIWESQIACLSASHKWSSPTKSSPSHFSRYFPDDPWLKMWASLTTETTKF
jgi:hypothetical protein